MYLSTYVCIFNAKTGHKVPMQVSGIKIRKLKFIDLKISNPWKIGFKKHGQLEEMPKLPCIKYDSKKINIHHIILKIHGKST